MFKIVVNNSRIELYNVDRLNGKKKGLQASSTHINMTVDMRTTMAAIISDMLCACGLPSCLWLSYHRGSLSISASQHFSLPL